MRTDLQKFQNLLDELGIKYVIVYRAGDVKELQICHEYLYSHFRDGRVLGTVSVAFNKNGKFMYFDGMSI